MRWLSLTLVLIANLTYLAACGPSGLGRIAPIVQENGNHGAFWQRLGSNTNCAEVGEEVVFTAQITNESTKPLTVTDDPPFDIVIRPFKFGNNAGPIQRWSETDQYPQDINPVLAPGETRTYTWRWRADAVYAQGSVRQYGTAVMMPLTIEGNGASPVPDVVVGVTANGAMGNGGVFCSALR